MILTLAGSETWTSERVVLSKEKSAKHSGSIVDSGGTVVVEFRSTVGASIKREQTVGRKLLTQQSLKSCFIIVAVAQGP